MRHSKKLYFSLLLLLVGLGAMVTADNMIIHKGGNIAFYGPSDLVQKVQLENENADLSVYAKDGKEMGRFAVSEIDSVVFSDEPSVQVNLNTCFQTSCSEAGNGLGYYQIALASGEVTFDEESFSYRTVDDGYVMYFSLYGLLSDPVNPELPAGVYVLSGNVAENIWHSQGANALITYTQAEGMGQKIPESGVLDVVKDNGEYVLTATFRNADGSIFQSVYRGSLIFPGKNVSLEEPVNTTFIGGQAIYRGPDDFFSEYGVVSLELWDVEPEELGLIRGNLLKCKLFIDVVDGEFTAVPAGSYMVDSWNVGPFYAESGFDNGTDIPTGTYIAQSFTETPLLGMINSGTIEVKEDRTVVVDLVTEEGVSVKGHLDIPFELLDLSGGQGEPENLYSTLTEDKVLDLSGASTAYFLDYGDYYKNGTRNVVLQILDGTNNKGMLLDLALPIAEEFAPLPDCVCTVDNGRHAEHTFAPGVIESDLAVGSWGYVELIVQGNQSVVDLSNAGNANSGTVEIKRNGDLYTIKVDFLDDAETPHSISGEWSGTLTPYSYTSASASPIRIKKLQSNIRRSFVNKVVKK